MEQDAEPDEARDAVGGAPPAVAMSPARVRARLAAGAIDLAMVAAAVMSVGQPFPPVLPIAAFVVYHAVLTWWLQRTVGKALLGLRVERPGGRVSLWWAIARSGPGYLLLGFLGFGLLFAVVDAHRRAPYDLALGGFVAQETDAEQRPRGLLDRLVEYADVHKETAAERRKKLTALAALWGWVVGIVAALRTVLQWLRGETAASAPNPSIAGVLSGKAAAVAAAAVAAVAPVVVLVVPGAGSAGDWLMTERYWLGGAPSGDPAADDETFPSESSQAAIADWMSAQGETYVGTCPYPPTDEAGTWCTTEPQQVSVDQVPALRTFGVAEGEVHMFAPSDSFHPDGALLVVEELQGWRVAAIQLWPEGIDEEPVPPSRWMPAAVGIEGAFDEVYGQD